MSTLSLRKIKHDSSTVDNITLGSTGRVSIKSPGADGLVLETDSVDSTCSTRIFAKNDAYTGGVYFDNTGWNITTGSTIGSASGLSRLNITRDGYVKMPYQPAFHAYPSSTVSVSSGNNKFTFNATKFNVGNHYSTSTGRFTAPVAGVYLFTFQAYYYPGNTSDAYQGIQLFMNGSGVYAGYARGGYGDTTWGNSIHLYMNVNDYIEYYTYPQSANNLNSTGSYLTGHLVG